MNWWPQKSAARALRPFGHSSAKLINSRGVGARLELECSTRVRGPKKRERNLGTIWRELTGSLSGCGPQLGLAGPLVAQFVALVSLSHTVAHKNCHSGDSI